ncbi:hypothetical protein [Lacisediminimonas profundi]|uniref:hypothetical protein n=1 Tax=Lacisediminimonas profundi TaxID=2603856 RepID=UPI00124B74F2|nr:hypothetical protein [Lacisediminimonas profundi]
MRRAAALLTVLMLSACVSDPATRADSGNVEIQVASGGQPVPGARCVVATSSGRWDVTPPAVVPVGVAAGDLRVSCSKPGYRSSEVLYRPSPYGVAGNPNVGVGIGGGSGNVGVGVGFNFPIGGGRSVGGYPARIVVEMNPQ